MPKIFAVPRKFKCVIFPAFHTHTHPVTSTRTYVNEFILMASICHHTLGSFHALFRRLLATLLRTGLR